MIKTITFKEALVDSLRFYGEDTSRRSRHQNECLYLHNDGRRCAVGRFIRPGKEEFFRTMDNIHNSSIEAAVHAHQHRSSLEGKKISESEAILELTVITDATIGDLLFLEVLHDEDANWDINGLTSFGQETIAHFRPDIAKEVLEEAHGVAAE